jgi:hypothetical protein
MITLMIRCRGKLREEKSNGTSLKRKNNQIGCFSHETEFWTVFQRNGWPSQNNWIKLDIGRLQMVLHCKHILKNDLINICG